ncbi:HAD family hydrolase [Clavibacter californiensis]|uniref:HAD family phosphatase n=1 Tax=Clavibacter californiensis TaxID=1401995 RepID=A0ABX9NB73_9MICO|nr:HAD family phosphatase [Clavibacter californiensis]RII94021.1 HAD family phosphatase [Clavibacter californiensis]UKF79300.1 HAD family phosphatase [Clavibacter californiensis]
MISNRPAAVLWDMDGTIVDTEPYWMVAEEALVGSFGGTWTPEDGLRLVGNGLDDSARILQEAGVDLPVQEIIDRLSDRVMEQILVEVPWRPGARELLRGIREAGIPTALVTMSIGRMARQVADAVPFDAFDHVVAGDDVSRSKPHPEAYLAAADLLGVDIRDCVAIEDSAPGVASATASGATVIAVPHHVPLPTDDAYVLWDTLAGRTLADLEAAHADRRAAASIRDEVPA